MEIQRGAPPFMTMPHRDSDAVGVAMTAVESKRGPAVETAEGGTHALVPAGPGAARDEGFSV